jgi:4-hydroxy-L-threonine phosphate dehydrogenase PdxA
LKILLRDQSVAKGEGHEFVRGLADPTAVIFNRIDRPPNVVNVRRRTDMLITELRAEITASRVIAVLGSGASSASTGPTKLTSWKGLLEDGVRYAAEVNAGLAATWADEQLANLTSSKPDQWLETAQKITTALGGPRGGDYARWLRASVGSLQCQSPDVIQTVSSFAKSIWTTNYDSLIEQATGLRATTWQQRSMIDRLVRGDEKFVMHLHGYWEEPESVILGVKSYGRLLANEHSKNAFRSLVAGNTLLFIGFGAGLDDPNFGAFRRWLKRSYMRSEYRHYRLVTKKEMEKVDFRLAQEERLFAIAYGTRHSDLPQFLKTLVGPEVPPVVAPKRTQIETRSQRSAGLEKPRIAISMGDANGIGPEVVLKALRDFSEVRRICVPVVVGSAEILRRVRQRMERTIALPAIVLVNRPSEATDSENAIWVVDVPHTAAINADAHCPDPEVARLSIACTRRALEYGKEGQVAAVVSAPVSKEACLMVDSTVRGHTELVAQTFGLTDYGSLYISPDLAIAAVTGHCPLGEVLVRLNRERITRTIVRAARQLAFWRPDAPRRIGVCSINPHVGEGGRLGTEDQEIVAPAISDAEALLDEFCIDGPSAADALFRPQIRVKYGLIVAMYHDQAKVATAALDPNTFVAVVVGSPVIRTTVTHGTAFDIAGSTTASAANLITAIEQAVYLSPRGSLYLRESRELTATKFFSVEVRLNTHTREKSLLGEALVSLLQVTQFFRNASEEVRVVVGPGSTPTLVMEHFLAWVRRLSKERQRPIHIVTDSLELLESVRRRGEARPRISIFGSAWDPAQNSLGPTEDLDMVLAQYQANISIISCSGLDLDGDEVRFYSYTGDHADVLTAIVKSHRESPVPPAVHPLIVLATGEKLGHPSSEVYCRGGELPEGTVLLLEVEREVLVASGPEEIKKLVTSVLATRQSG